MLLAIAWETMPVPVGDDAPEPGSVLAAFGLGGSVTAVTVVGGAWSNRVYRLDAGAGSFAVKEMCNPWADPGWERWLAEAWSFEQRALAAGVSAPLPVANPADGGCLAWVRRRTGAAHAAVRLHRWAEGRPARPGPVAPAIAVWAGQTLATLHGLGVRAADRGAFPVLSTDTARRWPELAGAAQRAGAAWAGLMTEVMPAVSEVAELAREAGHQPQEEVMTHGDIDQKNLIITPGGPVLCDWDLAAPLVPRRELADVALSLAGWQAFDIAREVVRSYRQAGGDDTGIQACDLGQPMMIGLDWVAFNVERALGRRPAVPAEAARAHELIPGLLAAIPRQAGTALRIRDVLRL